MVFLLLKLTNTTSTFRDISNRILLEPRNSARSMKLSLRPKRGYGSTSRTISFRWPDSPPEEGIPLVRYIERKGYATQFLLLVFASFFLLFWGGVVSLIPVAFRVGGKFFTESFLREIIGSLGDDWVDPRHYHRALREEQAPGLCIFSRA